MIARTSLVRPGLVVGWLLLLLAIAQQATIDSDGSAPPLQIVPGRIGLTTASSAVPLTAAGSPRPQPEAPASTAIDLATLAEQDIPTMESRVHEWHQDATLDEGRSLGVADALLDDAVAMPKSQWRKRAGRYAAAGLILREYYSTIPSELERAADALLVSAQLFGQNGSTTDAVAARDRAQAAYNEILNDRRVTDERMVAAVKRKLGRSQTIVPEAPAPAR